MPVEIDRAQPEDTDAIATMAGELLHEIMAAIGQPVFGFDHSRTRLEVTTPPLPQCDRTLAFYRREGFGISGGRKMKMGDKKRGHSTFQGRLLGIDLGMKAQR